MKARFTWMTLLLTGFLTLAGCGGNNEVDLTTDTTMTDTGLTGIEQETVAIANLEPTQGNNTRGTVTFTQMGEVVRIQANITGLAPGQHGFHIHENGDCSNNAEAAGGHYNPAGTPHGGPHAPVGQRHVGDFGNIEAGADGTATFERTDSLVTLSGMNSVVGKAVVVHAGADDLQSQPSGNSGARVACGVIWMEGDMGLMQDTTMTDTTTTDTTGF